MENSKNILEVVTKYLLSIVSGDYRLDEATIRNYEDSKLREVLTGLLYLQEDIVVHNNTLVKSNKKLQATIDELNESKISVDYSNKRINDLLRVVEAMARRDFNSRAKIDGDGDQFDGLAIGLNMLCEELEATTVSKKALQTSELKYRSLVNTMEAGILMVDNEEKILFVNSYLSQLLGYSKDEMLGKNANTLLTNSSKERSKMKKRVKERRIEGKGGSYEHVMNAKNCSPIWTRVRACPIIEPTGEVTGSLGVVTDIRESKQQLELIDKQNEELKKANNALDSFVYSVSHDLKSPIINQLTMVEMLKKAIQNENNHVKTIVDNLEKSSLQFQQTVDDFLTLSRLERVELTETKKLALKSVVTEIIDSMKNDCIATDAKIKLNFTKCQYIDYSETIFSSIIRNLVGNAIKYRSPKRKPIITISGIFANGNAVISVKDNGLGIDLHKDGVKLFQMFKRLHAHVSGTGIGLYMVKKIVEDRGGMVKVKSTLGKGSTFSVHIPQQTTSTQSQ